MGLPRRLTSLLGIELPVIQAPMAGVMDAALVVAACEGGALGSLPCAMLTPDTVREQVLRIRAGTRRPINLNFFCHAPAAPDEAARARWQARFASYFTALGLDPAEPARAPVRSPFDEPMLAVVEELRPEVVSFHFGLPEPKLFERVKALGAVVLASATTVEEAVFLEERGVDAVIAQGAEAGGHRGMFLATSVAAQPGTMALVPQVVDAVKIPVVAAGGIADGRGMAAALALGAHGVQIGTAYLGCRESTISPLFRAALAGARADSTVLTNVMTGRPARSLENRVIRELGPLAPDVPPFPHAAAPLAKLRAAAERAGSADFSPFWSGQSAALSRPGIGAAEYTRDVAAAALRVIDALANRS